LKKDIAEMKKIFRVAVVASTVSAFVAMSYGQTAHAPSQQPDMKSAFTTADFSALPSMPKGRSTILGGQITNLDPVLDQFTLRIGGQRAMKILFDERTQVYRNGIRIPLRDLRSEQHASVQTALEGANIFAISIHMLTDLPQNECRGNVLDYNPDTRELTISSSISSEPIRLLLRDDTRVERQGQSTFVAHSAGVSDLVNGALVTASFDASDKGRAVANRVTVLAKPGASFVFSGKITSLDMGAGRMTLVDPRDQKSYQVSFDPDRFPSSDNLHVGDQVRVSATFDGTRYAAAELARIQATQP
jgi:hypothetical protein